MYYSLAALLIRVNYAAMSAYENDPPSISDRSLNEMWLQLFDHYHDAYRWRYSCQQAKWRRSVQQ